MQPYDLPDNFGHFGQFGGTFVAETLIEALDELRDMYEKYKNDPDFLEEFHHDLKHFVGRPSPIYFAERLTSGSKTLKDALNEALRDWVTNVSSTFYIIGTVAGPHPYPMMVRDFNSVVGKECKIQMPELENKQPDVIVACVGGGSNAMGIFYPYIDDKNVKLIGVEAAGDGIETGKHAAPLTSNSAIGVLHGNRTYLMQNDEGQIIETHSVSAGLDYPGVGPEHSWLKDSGRASYVAITDKEALAAFHNLCLIEGIIPALETSHALAYAEKIAAKMSPEEIILVNLSGRGDKDINTVADISGISI